MLQLVWKTAYDCCQESEGIKEQIEYFRSLYPGWCNDQEFLGEVAWVIYNSGMKNTVIGQKWPGIKKAFWGFNPDLIVLTKKKSIKDALRVISHEGKASAVVATAQKVIQDKPIRKKLKSMTEEEALAYFQTYPFVGPVTKYHLARNCGFDVVKPDLHMERLTDYLGYGTPDKMVFEIAKFSGERKGVIDYVLWQWLSLKGKAAYTEIDYMFRLKRKDILCGGWQKSNT